MDTYPQGQIKVLTAPSHHLVVKLPNFSEKLLIDGKYGPDRDRRAVNKE